MRVLVIEDEARLQKLLRRGLTEEGFRVDVAAEGEDGLHRAKAENYDAIVLDLMIPKMPGGKVLEALRQEGRTTPVLILTARDAAHEKIAGLNAGADDYMTKPFTFDELIARLRALVRRVGRGSRAVIRMDDLEVDTDARRVTRGGTSIELRAKEYALLELLALHHGQVVTHSQIYNHLYQRESDTLSNVVDVHVCRLRSRIDRDFKTPLIHTVRGQGYVLKPGMK